LHGEQNALIKAGAATPGKVMFVTVSPCVMCAKMVVNCNVARVYYRTPYRDPAGVELLEKAGVAVERYDRWRDEWRESGAGGNVKTPVALTSASSTSSEVGTS
jgi:deoxycytidylate deaminase